MSEGRRTSGKLRSRLLLIVAALLGAVGAGAAGTCIAGVHVSGALAQESATGALYHDAGRVDSLRASVDAGRLAELRREADTGGDARDWYDLGAALLLSGDLQGAVQPLERVAGAEDSELGQSAAYNLGVAHGVGARPREDGRANGSGAPRADAARAELVRARDAFRRVLRADPRADDARWNLEVVNRWLRKMGGAGGGQSAGGGGQQGEEGERREMSPEEVQRLLQAAASEERRVQQERFQRSRARDPVAERNW
jgi:tetratricopeptide (TPR) repeat protein